MQSCTGKARISLVLVVAALVLAGVCLEGRHASAQTPVLIQAQEECPLPAGVSAPPEPPVTAQQVENGDATLEEFALAAVNQFKGVGSDTLTPAQLAFSGCRLRLEDGPWYSGSTYIVTLTPNGRVYLHAKEMSLSASKLNPAIYAGILAALGAPLTVLQGLDSPLTFLESEPGPVRFDLTEATNRRPGFPGVSGYAAAYRSVNTERPLILLTGFDLNASHLMEEDINYGNPAIKASDVVNRTTLKAFVEEALKFIIQTQADAGWTADSRVAFQRARLALRDRDDGPWIDGPVYIHIVDGVNKLIQTV